MQITSVGAQDELLEFVEFPWRLYADDPSWVPPLREQILYDLSGASAFARYGRSQLFLCQENGRTAGRIAALINPRLTDEDGRVFGQLGYFECVDDPDTAAALVDAGVSWLRAQGTRAVLAPMNGGAHKAHRLMTRGFDCDPFLFEPRNPAYYPSLLAKTGFTPVHRWFSYELDRAEASETLGRFDRMLARRPPPGSIENLGPERAQEVTLRVHRLLDECWRGHVGYAHIDLDEFSEVFSGGLSIMSPGNVGIFHGGGKDLGFSFVFPDYVDDVRALAGQAAGWGNWLGKSRPDRLVLHTAALVPEVRAKTAAMAQVAWALRTGMSSGYERQVIALAVEGFLGRIGEMTREYTLYGRAIA
jgi:hypothetical protein